MSIANCRILHVLYYDYWVFKSWQHIYDQSWCTKQRENFVLKSLAPRNMNQVHCNCVTKDWESVTGPLIRIRKIVPRCYRILLKGLSTILSKVYIIYIMFEYRCYAFNDGHFFHYLLLSLILSPSIVTVKVWKPSKWRSKVYRMFANCKYNMFWPGPGIT